MRSETLRTAIIVAMLVLTDLILTLILVNANHQEVAEVPTENNATVIVQNINGTTTYMLYQVGDTIYLYERGGYGKPEQSVWSEEDMEDTTYGD